ncbi:MAG: sigma-54-dependent Fis family transcriptional regulator [Planctomycetes bacterium]|nr:sigma-54-dependent Fis family transcriptional regulator [Planctomycetota bacterium]
MSSEILVVEAHGSELWHILETKGHSVSRCASFDEAHDRLRHHAVEICVFDQDLPDWDPSVLSQCREAKPEVPILLISGFGTVESAVEALRLGAFDFLGKPVLTDEFLLSLERALAQRTLVAENRTLRRALDRHRKLDNIVGTSDRMNRIFEVVESVAPTRATVLITGESGTGKTRLARAVHELSPRHEGPFVEVNCGALPDSLLESELFGHAKGAFTGALRDKAGKFEDADGGTIFLDEIATASTALQIKLLRVIQDRMFERVGETKTRTSDARIVLATNSDLLELVDKGEFREDLYYRINVVNVELPSLRERHEDVPYLLDHFLQLFCDLHGKAVEGIEPAALDAVLTHSWPGNIRELENAIERAVVLARGPRIELADLPPALHRRDRGEASRFEESDEILPLRQALEEPERRIIERALELNDWNRQRTADMLEVNRTTLFHKMKKYGLLETARSVRPRSH